MALNLGWTKMVKTDVAHSISKKFQLYKEQKKVDVLDINQLKENMDLLNEILRDGIKIYR